ncbi:hypothetical protein KKB40_04390 [Patescibacteria group bacterium]|nr:hypothetical protein [Patescibacteria group bacterium]
MFNYSSIIKRSVEIVKKSKWLLVYGLVLASLGAGGGGGGGSSSFDLPEEFNLQDLLKTAPEDIPEKTSQVLGTFTSTAGEWLRNVPLVTWISLAFAILVVVLIGITVRYILTSWVKGALIYGTQLALEEGEVNLKNTSPTGIDSIKNLIIFNVIMFSITLGLFALLPIFWTLIYVFIKNVSVLKVLWLIAGTIGVVVAFFIVFVLFAMVSIYAERLIVLKKFSP